MKRCVVSFANAQLHYGKGVRRIERFLKKKSFNGDFLYWIAHEEYPPGCPSHGKHPYAFKPWCFSQARGQGYDCVLWIDASVIPLDLGPIFAKIQNQGYYFMESSFKNRKAGEMCSDAALENFGMSRQEALKVRQVESGCLGVNFQSPKAQIFFQRWMEKSLDGVSFKGYSGRIMSEKTKAINSNLHQFASKHPRVLGHRHDQTIAALIAYSLKMKIDKVNTNQIFVDRMYVKRGFKSNSYLINTYFWFEDHFVPISIMRYALRFRYSFKRFRRRCKKCVLSIFH